MPQQFRICCLVSGDGSNLQALLDAISSGDIENAKITLVVCNRKEAYARVRARNAGVREVYHNIIKYSKQYPSSEPGVKHSPEARKDYDAELAKIVLEDCPSLVVCAGWMHVLSSDFLEPLSTAKIPAINLHPALPGAFNGANAISRAYEAYKKGEIEHTGVMTHYVIREVDMGKPIVTREVPFQPNENLEEFETRLHDVEHALIVEGTNKAIAALQ